MRFSPRAEEIAAVVDVLESDEFESAGDMAKAVLKEAAQILAMRDTVAVVLAFPGDGRTVHHLLGPYYSTADAQAVVGWGSAAEKAGVAKLSSPGRHAGLVNGGVEWSGFCRCGHHPTDHLTDGNSRGRCGWTVSGKCDCQSYEEFGPKKKATKKTKASKGAAS